MITREKALKICTFATTWLLMAAVFLIPVLFAPAYEIYSVFVLYKVAALRVLVSLAAVFFLAKVFLEGRIRYRFGNFIFIALSGLALSWLASACLAAIPVFGFWGHYNHQQGFFTLIFYLVFFLLLLFDLSRGRRSKDYLIALLASSFFVSAYALMQFWGLDPIKWMEMGRVFSSFGQPNSLGLFLILVMPFTVYAIFFWARRFPARLALILLLFGQLLCLLLTYSRSAWLGLAAEAVLLVFGILLLRKKRRSVVLLAGFLAVGFILVAALSNQYVKNNIPNLSLGGRIATLFDFSQGTVRVRLNTWQAAIAEFKSESLARKFFGHGPDSLFEPFAKHYRGTWALDEKLNVWPDRAHNQVLDILLSFGLVGLLAYFIFVVYLLRLGWNFWKTAPRDENFWLAAACFLSLFGYFVNNLFSFSDTSSFLIFYLSAGLLVFIFSSGDKEKESAVRLSSFSRWAIIVFLSAAVSIFIFYYNLKEVRADYYFMRAVKNGFRSCSELLNDNKRAVDSSFTGNSLFYQGEYLNNSVSCLTRFSDKEERDKIKDNIIFYLGRLPADKYFYFAEREAKARAKLAFTIDSAYLGEAEKDFAALADKYPGITLIYEDWVKFELEKKDYDLAIKVAERGIATLPLDSLNSRGPSFHVPEIREQAATFYGFLGSAYHQKKDYDRALSSFGAALDLDPPHLSIYKEMGDVYYEKGDLDRAIISNEKGYSLNRMDYAWPLAIGLLLSEKGDKQEAKRYFSEALRLRPGDAEIEKLLEK